MHNLIVSLFSGRNSLCIQLKTTSTTSSHEITTAISDATAIPQHQLRISTTAGTPLPDELTLLHGETTHVSANLRILGGKGGFGSMLRAQGGRMASQKTTNFEACRDLNGRRLKTVNEAKKLADYLEKEPERQKSKEEKLRQKIEKGLKVPEPKKRRFNDPKFFEQTTEMGEDVSTAVLQVMKKSKNSSSSSNASAVSAKPASTSLGIWDDEISSEEDEDEVDGEENPEDEGEVNGRDGDENQESSASSSASSPSTSTKVRETTQ